MPFSIFLIPVEPMISWLNINKTIFLAIALVFYVTVVGCGVVEDEITTVSPSHPSTQIAFTEPSPLKISKSEIASSISVRVSGSSNIAVANAKVLFQLEGVTGKIINPIVTTNSEGLADTNVIFDAGVMTGLIKAQIVEGSAVATRVVDITSGLTAKFSHLGENPKVLISNLSSSHTVDFRLVNLADEPIANASVLATSSPDGLKFVLDSVVSDEQGHLSFEIDLNSTLAGTYAVTLKTTPLITLPSQVSIKVIELGSVVIESNTPGALSLCDQTLLADQTQGQPVVVHVYDSSGTPVPGIPVSFSTLNGFSVLTPATDQTDLAGRASAVLTTLAVSGPAQELFSAEIESTGIVSQCEFSIQP